jgi:hypothetical protein
MSSLSSRVVSLFYSEILEPHRTYTSGYCERVNLFFPVSYPIIPTPVLEKSVFLKFLNVWLTTLFSELKFIKGKYLLICIQSTWRWKWNLKFALKILSLNKQYTDWNGYRKLSNENVRLAYRNIAVPFLLFSSYRFKANETQKKW